MLSSAEIPAEASVDEHVYAAIKHAPTIAEGWASSPQPAVASNPATSQPMAFRSSPQSSWLVVCDDRLWLSLMAGGHSTVIMNW